MCVRRTSLRPELRAVGLEFHVRASVMCIRYGAIKWKHAQEQGYVLTG